MDAIDLKILALLQRDATLSIAAIGEKVGLSQTPCWKRIQRLEADGVIDRRVAVLDPVKLGLGLTVFVSIETADHSQDWLQRFADTVSAMPEVLEFYRMAGDVDYMLRVVVADMQAYDAFYKRLISVLPLKNVTSRFAMEKVKSTTALPLPAPPRRAGICRSCRRPSRRSENDLLLLTRATTAISSFRAVLQKERFWLTRAPRPTTWSGNVSLCSPPAHRSLRGRRARQPRCRPRQREPGPTRMAGGLPRRARRRRGSGPGGARPGPQGQRAADVIYASESGNSEKLAGDVAKLARKQGFRPKVVDFADLDLATLPKAGKLVAIAATWGEGEPPARACGPMAS